jgi:hypothetical protein
VLHTLAPLAGGSPHNGLQIIHFVRRTLQDASLSIHFLQPLSSPRRRRFYQSNFLMFSLYLLLKKLTSEMNEHIKKLQQEIEPIRQQLIQHSIYANIKTIKDLNVFMEHHVYAVWDFMSLLKSLQRNLTCVELPWIPVGSAQTRYLINEIVLGEESDVDEAGKRTSHFELYLSAMKQTGCDLTIINSFIKNLTKKIPVNESAIISNVPGAAVDFINNTFTVVNSNAPHIQSAVFTFGREDLIPGMFMSFVSELNKQSDNKISILKYYLERHIEVDGDHHSHLAYQMTEELSGTDEKKWEESTIAVKDALRQRIKLWDSILHRIKVS